MKRAILIAVPPLVTALVFYALSRAVSLEEVGEALVAVDVWPLVIAIVASLVFNTLQSAETLRHMLRGFGVRVPYPAALAATTGNLAIHSVMPASTGNAGRVAYLVRRHGAELGPTVATVIAILWFKLWWLVLLAAVGHALSPTNAVAPAILMLVLVGMGACTGLAPRVVRSGARLARWFVKSQDPEPIRRAFGAARWRRLAGGICHAFLAVAAELVIFGLLLSAVGHPIEPAAILALFPLCVIGAKLPIAIMGLGTREALVVALFDGLAPAEALLAAALLYSLVEHVLPALAGLPLTWWFTSRIVEGDDRP